MFLVHICLFLFVKIRVIDSYIWLPPVYPLSWRDSAPFLMIMASQRG